MTVIELKEIKEIYYFTVQELLVLRSIFARFIVEMSYTNFLKKYCKMYKKIFYELCNICRSFLYTSTVPPVTKTF